MGIAVGLGFIKTIVFGAYLSPKFMGYYAIAVTIAGYGTFLQLGLMSGLNRELPVCLGSRKEKYSSDLIGETTIAIISLQLIGIIIYFCVLGKVEFDDSCVRNACFLAGLLAFASPFGQMVMLRLRAEQRILSFSSLQLINALGILLLGMLAIQYMSYKGAILARVFVHFGSFIIVSKTILNPVNYFYFKLRDIIYLIRIGLPMMAAGILLNLQMSMDRLFLIKNVSATEIGIYQIGILPLTMGLMLGSIANQYVGPKLLFRYGQGIVTLYSSMGFEVMMLGKPVFVLGEPWYRNLPGIYGADSPLKLAELLQDVRRLPVASDEEKLKVVYALYDMSFNGVRWPDERTLEPENIEEFAKAIQHRVVSPNHC